MKLIQKRFRNFLLLVRIWNLRKKQLA